MLGMSARLVTEICNRWSIPIDRDHVIGHREIYARKTCPGTWIDLDDFVARVRQVAVDPTSYNVVEQPGSVQARLDLNLRVGAPTTLSPRPDPRRIFALHERSAGPPPGRARRAL